VRKYKDFRTLRTAQLIQGGRFLTDTTDTPAHDAGIKAVGRSARPSTIEEATFSEDVTGINTDA
jgi:hypothetical protein